MIDGLAAQGIRFTQGYANSPVCSPTRFALITARYQYRLRGAAEEPINSKSTRQHTLGLPPEHPTVASLLREAGYRTALIGKWHLGYPPHFGPLRSGYEEFFGPMSGGVDYFTHCIRAAATTSGTARRTPRGGYLTDLLSRRAVDYVGTHGSRATTRSSSACTTPRRTGRGKRATTRHELRHLEGQPVHLDGGNVHTYRRMIHHMDEGIGWIMEALRKHGIENNTLVVFTSDNGGERFSDNWPLVGGKLDLTEGGIRVPWIAHWPEAIRAGRVSPQHCMTMDWSATVIDAAGARPEAEYPLDGVSLLPLLRDESPEFSRPMYWRMNHRGQRALRQGDWKYLRVDEHDYLFDLTKDERERANLARQEPERLSAMRREWERWSEELPPIPADAFVGITYTKKDMP